MENVDLQSNTFGNVKTAESAIYLTYCSQTKGKYQVGFAGGGQALEAAAGGEGGLNDQGD